MKSASGIDLSLDLLRKLPGIVVLRPDIFHASAAFAAESEGLGVARV
jgi:hypothetical protein